MFTLERWGEFEVAIQPDTPHCGPDGQILRTFGFYVTVRAGDDALDEHGFLVDNLTLSAYFEKTYGDPAHPVNHSCEQISKAAAFGIRGLIPKLSACEEIRVRIKPFEGAAVTYIWVAEKPGCTSDSQPSTQTEA